ncbi:MAG: hypothetical protein V1798_01890 [Pseudomonadota bacterium]
MIPEPIRVALHISGIFEDLRVGHFLGGSLASSIYGEPRATNDVDIAAALRTIHIKSFVAALKHRFYIDKRTVETAVQKAQSFNVIEQESVQKVDIFVLGDMPFDRAQLRRRQLVVVQKRPKKTLYVSSPEDLVLRKLIWFEKGARISDRQWRDVTSVLRVQSKRLDTSYMRRWARRLQIDKLLGKAIKEAGF